MMMMMIKTLRKKLNWTNSPASTGEIELSRFMIKPTKWHVRPAKTQTSLGSG